MSEIIKVVDPPILRFGKHSGKSAAEVMDVDPEYVQWVLAQPWFQEKNPQLVQFFVRGGVGGGEASETPEHNALQAKFTQDAYCLAAAAMFSAGQRIRNIDDAQKEGEALAGPALEGRVQSYHPEIEDRHFELNAWDVQFSFTGAYSELDTSVEPSCSCEPLPLPEVPSSPLHRGSEADSEAWDEYHRLGNVFQQAHRDRSRVAKINEDREQSKFNPHGRFSRHRMDFAFNDYVNATQHEGDCPRASTAYFRAWPGGYEELVISNPRRLGLELKPVMGDDFPAVLRQVLGYLNRPSKHGAPSLTAVVVGEFQSAAVPWPVVKQQFWESGVLLVREAELDALVEKHAHEWGADLVDQDTDFEVNFTNQL